MNSKSGFGGGTNERPEPVKRLSIGLEDMEESVLNSILSDGENLEEEELALLKAMPGPLSRPPSKTGDSKKEAELKRSLVEDPKQETQRNKKSKTAPLSEELSLPLATPVTLMDLHGDLSKRGSNSEVRTEEKSNTRSPPKEHSAPTPLNAVAKGTPLPNDAYTSNDFRNALGVLTLSLFFFFFFSPPFLHIFEQK
jgi:hypothetical protein